MSERSGPPIDPFAEFDIGCEFPFAIDAFAELRRYVQVANEFISHSSAQCAVRIQARLERADDPVQVAELQFELDAVKRDEAVTLPRIVWGGILLSVFATYEYGVRSALRHWQKTTGYPDAFRRLPRKGFLESAEHYAKNAIGVSLLGTDKLSEAVKELNSFRNSFAHGSGLLSDLPQRLQRAIQEQEQPGVAIQTTDGQWIANARSAAYFLVRTERSVEQFGTVVLEKCLVHHRLRAQKA